MATRSVRFASNVVFSNSKEPLYQKKRHLRKIKKMELDDTLLPALFEHVKGLEAQAIADKCLTKKAAKIALEHFLKNFLGDDGVDTAALDTVDSIHHFFGAFVAQNKKFEDLTTDEKDALQMMNLHWPMSIATKGGSSPDDRSFSAITQGSDGSSSVGLEVATEGETQHKTIAGVIMNHLLQTVAKENLGRETTWLLGEHIFNFQNDTTKMVFLEIVAESVQKNSINHDARSLQGVDTHKFKNEALHSFEEQVSTMKPLEIVKLFAKIFNA